jgi:hypothetical protein
MSTHPKINQLEGGWYVIFRDGSVVTHKDKPWAKIPKKDIMVMGLKWRHKYIELRDKDNYIPPGETHMREISVARGDGVQVTKQQLVGQFIGYYGEKGKVITRINTATGRVTKEEIPYGTNKG